MRVRMGLLIGVAVIPLVGLTGVSGVGATDPWTAPHVEQIISGPSRPGVAAWGVAYNPVSGEIIVGDYASAQVRRFSIGGVHLGDFTNPNGSTQGVASAVAVDARDGSVYVAQVGDGRISRDVRKYDVAGSFLYDFDVPGSVAWLTVQDDGDLWTAEPFAGAKIHELRVSDATRLATIVRTVATPGTAPGRFKQLTGIDVDAAGNVYVADTGNGTVHVLGPTGTWLDDVGNRSRFPGDLRGVVVDDAAGRLYVADAHSGEIEVFTLSGAPVATFGSLGEAPGQFVDGARQLAVLPGGDLLAADYGARRVQRFTPDGGSVSQFPDPPQPAAPDGLALPRGIAVDPATGDVLVADAWNQRIQRFAPDGTLLAVHGRRGSLPPDGMNYPRSIAVDPATGHVWVPNYEGNPDLVVYDRDFRFLRRIDVPRFVSDIDIVGGVAHLVVRRTGSVMRIDTVTGTTTGTCCTGLGLLRGIAVDPVNGDYWLTSDTQPRVLVVRQDGTLVRQVSVDGRGWGVTIVGEVVYVADASANRVLAFDRLTGARLGSFGTAGSLPGQLRGPSGITHDADGDLYVVEERGGRVQVFGHDPLPAPETVAPGLTWTGPLPLTGAPLPLRLTGRANDASGVLRVEVLVQHVAAGTSWNATSALWSPSATWNQAVISGPASDVAWSFTVVPATAGTSFLVRVRATDVHGVQRTIARTVSTTA